ncbi:unnamed protein product, partial [Rotaria magnacalcarata]
TWRRNLHQFDEENENNKQELTDTIEMPNIDEINQPISIDDQATR